MSLGPALRRLLAAGIVVVWLAPAPAQAQERDRVVLLESSSDDEVFVEVLSRVRGELGAAGFEVVVLPAPEDTDPRAAVETAGRELEPVAVFLVHRGSPSNGESAAAELWVSDRLLNRTFVQRLTVDGPQRGNAARLAVQAVELLRARLAELALTRPPEPVLPAEPSPPPSPPEPAPVAPVDVAPERRGNGLGIEAGFGLLQGFRGIDRAFMPILRLGVSLPESWLGSAPLGIDLRGSVGAPSSAHAVESDPGSARVNQAFGNLDVVVRFAPTLPVQPMLSLGSGAYVVDVQGEAPVEYSRTGRRTWSGMTSVGTGLWLSPFEGVACVFEGQLMAAWSKTVVRLHREEVAQAGAPMVLLSAGAMAVFR